MDNNGAYASAAALVVQGRDVPWLFRQWVTRTPDKPFLLWAPEEGEHRQWTYAEFDADIRKVAGGLMAQGVQKGQRVLIHLENCPEHLMSYFACAYLGAVAVLTNTRSVGEDLRYFCELTKVVGAITQPGFANELSQAAPQLSFIAVTETDAGAKAPAATSSTNADGSETNGEESSKETGEESGRESGEEGGKESSTPSANAQPCRILAFSELQNHPAFLDRRTPEPMLDLRVQFTSGTTSRPKAVLSTHANSIYAAQQTSLNYGLQSTDIGHCVVPLFHTNGLSVVVMGSLWSGGAVLLQRKFSTRTFWSVALHHRATWASLPSRFFLNALAGSEVPKHHFRFWFCGVLPEVEARYKVKTRGHWGMTEMITLPLIGDPHHPEPRLAIGRPGPGSDIQIRRGQRLCEPGETGSLWVRGVRGITLFKEYLNDPKATEASFDKGGWFNTGDRVRIDNDGHIYFADREKDILRVGGENVAASEIEAVIQQLDWVKECAVVGQAHPMLDEVPVAFITLNDSAATDQKAIKDALLMHCSHKLADFKQVREVFVIEEFPRATLNKIAKKVLRERLAEAAVK